eukprot:m.176991 g.176991  ORF g.176991 m.176991 type:complete len:397 (-) comp31867_c3_seq1:51-1241(-)
MFIMSMFVIWFLSVAISVEVVAQGPTSFNCSTQPDDVYARIHLKNKNGMSISFIRYGATLTNLIVPDKHGVFRDVVLGFDNATDYCGFGHPKPNHPYFGATIGRVANRIANGSFTIDGVTYKTPLNDHGIDTLHGGWVGYDRRAWTLQSSSESEIKFCLDSPDGEQGFPGEVAICVTHSITDDNEWVLNYEGKSLTKTTILAMTNHAYFNLNANVDDTSTVLEHVVTMPSATTYVEVDSKLLPTGIIGKVSDATYLDFTKSKTVGKDIDSGTATPSGGYDNALVFSDWKAGTMLNDVVKVSSSITGIQVSMSTDQPSVQIYSGNFLNSTDPTQRIPRKKTQTTGSTTEYYHWRGAITLEAQHYPDSVHHTNFPTTLLKKGETYTQNTRYRFSVSNE